MALAKRIFWLGDSHIDPGNNKFLTAFGSGPFTDGDTWGMAVNRFLGFDVTGRYTQSFCQSLANGLPAFPSELGSFYAVGGASVLSSNTPGDTSLCSGQMAKLKADYPTLPPNSVVVAAIGTNDLDGIPQSVYGTIWGTSGSQSWLVGATGFTLPTNGNTAVVSVVSSAGMSAGAAFLVSFVIAGVPYGPFQIQTVNSGVQITILGLPNSIGGGAAVGSGAVIKQSAPALIDVAISTLASYLTTLEGQNPALIVLPGNLNPGWLPGNAANLANFTVLWNYWQSQWATLIPVTSTLRAGWDLSGVWNDILNNYAPTPAGASRYGFKTTTAPWFVSQANNVKDYAMWDSLHPTSAAHDIIANRFMNEFLKPRGLM